MRRLDSNSGISLPELMVAVGIMGILAFYYMDNSKKREHMDAAATASQNARSELSRVVELVKSDVKYAKDPSIHPCATANCTNFNLVRNNTNHQAYQVNYSSRCQAIPDSLSKFFNFSFNTLQGKCFSSLNCPLGTYPQLQVSTGGVPAGTALLNYPAALPNLASYNAAKKGVFKNIVAAAACLGFNPIDDILTLTVDIAIFNEAMLPKLVSREVSLLEGTNDKNILVLPNN